MLTVAPTDLSELFGMETGHQVFKVSRVRLMKEIPVAFETGYVSHDLCPGIPIEDLRSSSLFDIITKKHALPLTRCADSVGMTTIDEREAGLLKKEAGAHVVLMDRILYTTNNRVVAFIRILVSSEDHRITYECMRSPGE